MEAELFLAAATLKDLVWTPSEKDDTLMGDHSHHSLAPRFDPVRMRANPRFRITKPERLDVKTLKLFNNSVTLGWHSSAGKAELYFSLKMVGRGSDVTSLTRANHVLQRRGP